MKTRTRQLLRRIEGAVLAVVGPVHLIYLFFFVDRSSTPADMYWGVVAVGIAYTTLGILILAKQLWALRPALVINAAGFIGVIVMFESSPLRAIDPYLIAVDCVSVPLLVYLNVTYRKLTAQAVSFGRTN